MIKFYITTTLPYVNAEPHLGFAMEIVRADVVARFHRAQGYEVFFNTGTDEHGIKIYRAALAAGKDVKAYVDEHAAKFNHLKTALNLSYDNFIRTTDPAHEKAAQAFWRVCNANGYIYKKNYFVKYCVGCELEKTDSEIVDGRCPTHPSLELELINEENYFFKFSEFGDRLLGLYRERPDLVIPDFRFNEIRAFVERGLQDFSISRLKTKLPWGVLVPDDPNHVMYVWFDALVNYISAIGWPADMKKFNDWWLGSGGVVQYCGKDNLRQQSAMWQAMLLAANLPPSKHIVIDGFINFGGQKMSKSLGNVASPFEIVGEYGTDALRYYLIRHIQPFEDSDYTDEHFRNAYNGNLANGLGNLISRIMKMAADHLPTPIQLPKVVLHTEFLEAFETFELNKALDHIWKEIAVQDMYIQETQPFKMVKENKAEGEIVIANLVGKLYHIAIMLQVFMPETAATIIELIKENKFPAAPLFPRK